MIDLNQGELEWLSNHLGHELQIHKSFYRLHESTIELSKVSRLLMAVDAGQSTVVRSWMTLTLMVGTTARFSQTVCFIVGCNDRMSKGLAFHTAHDPVPSCCNCPEWLNMVCQFCVIQSYMKKMYYYFICLFLHAQRS